MTTTATHTAWRNAAFKTIWNDTHPDYRGKREDGTLVVLGWAKHNNGSTVSHTAQTMSTAELEDRMAQIKKRSA